MCGENEYTEVFTFYPNHAPDVEILDHVGPGDFRLDEGSVSKLWEQAEPGFLIDEVRACKGVRLVEEFDASEDVRYQRLVRVEVLDECSFEEELGERVLARLRCLDLPFYAWVDTDMRKAYLGIDDKTAEYWEDDGDIVWHAIKWFALPNDIRDRCEEYGVDLQEIFEGCPDVSVWREPIQTICNLGYAKAYAVPRGKKGRDAVREYILQQVEAARVAYVELVGDEADEDEE